MLVVKSIVQGNLVEESMNIDVDNCYEDFKKRKNNIFAAFAMILMSRNMN